MAYFNRLPKGNYNNSDNIDLHKRLVLTRDIEDDWLTTYDLQDGETLHDVSYNLYDTVDYWWLLALLNSYDDVHYDMYIKDETLQKLAKQLQVMEFSSERDYLLFPPKCDIEYEVGGKKYYGEVYRKYIYHVEGEGGKFLMDVILEDIDFPMPSDVTINILNSSLVKVKVVDNSVYQNGDLVRQDFFWEDKLEDFARGIIIRVEDGYLYVDKTKDLGFVVSGDGVTSQSGKYMVGNALELSKKIDVEGSDITEAEVVDTFSVSEFGIRDLYYLYRYDRLSVINDMKQKLTVIKPTYLANLKNNLIIVEED